MTKLLLIFGLFTISHSLHAKSFSVKKLKPANVQYRMNPFLSDCRDLLNTSPFASGRVQILTSPDADSSDVLYIGLKLKMGYTAYLTDGKVYFKEDGQFEPARFSDEDIEIKTDAQGVASITIPYAADENGMRLPLKFKLPDGSRLEAFLQIKILDEDNLQAVVIPVVTVENQKGLCLKSQAWIGVGGSFFSYDQNIPDTQSSANFSSVTPLSFSAEIKYFASPSWALVGSYKSAPGKMKSGATSATVTGTAFQWDIFQIETQYRPYDTIFAHREWTFYPFFKLGVQDHKIPRLAIDENDVASIEKIQVTNGHVGVGLNVVDKSNYFAEAFLNYQSNFSNPGYDITSKLMFDGSLGAGKMLSRKVSIGLFWYGQWHQFNYKADSGRDLNPGEIKYFFSNVDVRLGWVF